MTSMNANEEKNDDPTNQFWNEKEIGKGGFGTVVKAKRRQTNELVAIKKMIKKDDDQKKKWQKEVAIMQKLNHPYIVQFHSAYHTDEHLCIVMEFCEGGSLEDIVFRVLRRPLSEEELVVVLKDALQGLDYLHGQKLIHRDIKPANMLLDAKAQCKLADFGLSRIYDGSRKKAMTRRCGTRGYKAPEVKTGDYGSKVDIWALGMCAVELVCMKSEYCDDGKKKYYRIPIEFVKNAHARNDTDLPALLAKTIPTEHSNHFYNFIALCLKQDANERPTASDLLKHPFLKFAKSRKALEFLVDSAKSGMDAYREAFDENNKDKLDDFEVIKRWDKKESKAKPDASLGGIEMNNSLYLHGGHTANGSVRGMPRSNRGYHNYSSHSTLSQAVQSQYKSGSASYGGAKNDESDAKEWNLDSSVSGYKVTRNFSYAAAKYSVSGASVASGHSDEYESNGGAQVDESDKANRDTHDLVESKKSAIVAYDRETLKKFEKMKPRPKRKNDELDEKESKAKPDASLGGIEMPNNSFAPSHSTFAPAVRGKLHGGCTVNGLVSGIQSPNSVFHTHSSHNTFAQTVQSRYKFGSWINGTMKIDESDEKEFKSNPNGYVESKTKVTSDFTYAAAGHSDQCESKGDAQVDESDKANRDTLVIHSSHGASPQAVHGSGTRLEKNSNSVSLLSYDDMSNSVRAMMSQNNIINMSNDNYERLMLKSKTDLIAMIPRIIKVTLEEVERVLKERMKEKERMSN